jgi:HSP90 family molecular chaperone
MSHSFYSNEEIFLRELNLSVRSAADHAVHLRRRLGEGEAMGVDGGWNHRIESGEKSTRGTSITLELRASPRRTGSQSKRMVTENSAPKMSCKSPF